MKIKSNGRWPRSEDNKRGRWGERNVGVPEDRESSNRLAAAHDPRTPTDVPS